jgi:peptidyl-prolyl cis-trans isomerase D
MVTLVRRQGLHDEAVRAVFSTDTSRLPAYAGVSAPDGRFVLYRITRVEDPPSVSAEQVRAASGQIAQLAAQEQFAAFVTGLREDAAVRIDKAKLMPAQQ